MPTGANHTTTGSQSKQKVTVYLGKARVKRTIIKNGQKTKDTVEVPVLSNVREYIQDKLNLPLATAAQLQQVKDNKTIYYDGCFHGRTVVVSSPVDGDKTAGGRPRTYSFPVPGFASRKILNEAFAGTRVKRWKFQGGRARSVPGAATP